MNDFLNNFKSAFNESHLTQASLSRRTGIPRSNIHDYLKGKYRPKQKRINILAKALEVDPQWLSGNKKVKINLEKAKNLILDNKPITKSELDKIVDYVRLLRLLEKN